MKKFKGLLITLIFTLFLTGIFSFSAFAAEGYVDTDAEYGTVTEADTELSEKEDEHTDGEADRSEENVFDEIYLTVCDNLDGVFSILAFLASLILTFCYKKGLLPLVRGALTSLKNGVGSLEKEAREGIVRTEDAVAELKDGFKVYEGAVERIESAIDHATERIDALARGEAELSDLRKVLITQIEMLYDVFMQSSLPQFSKDSVCERIGEMKKAILTDRDGE